MSGWSVRLVNRNFWCVQVPKYTMNHCQGQVIETLLISIFNFNLNVILVILGINLRSN